MQVEPNGRFTNTVTVPLLPSVNEYYSPDVYEYEYYLSPAQSWQSFGTLEIEINTDYYLTSQSESFNEREGGYSVKLEKLPEGELEFSLCTTPNPKYEGDSFSVAGIVILLVVLIVFLIIFVGPVIFAIVYLVKFSVKSVKARKQR